jgi:AcrR family transcriptional regulator
VTAAVDGRAGRRFAPGELRAALLQTSLELLAEVGLGNFSVAEVARRLGISTAAPYRHFRDRDHLLAAIATTVGHELAAEIRTAVAAAGDDPGDRFAATAAAYVRFAARRGAGFNVVYAAGLEKLHDEGLANAGRELMDVLLQVTADTGPRPVQESLFLVEALVSLAHGYATLHGDGFFARGSYSLDHIAARAAENSRRLLPAPPRRN